MEDNIYFKDRNNNEYTKYTKEEIDEKVNPFEPKTFIPILQELDFPYLEAVWARLLAQNYSVPTPNKNIFGKYLAKMDLKIFKKLRFSDSAYHKDLYRFAFETYGWESTSSGEYDIIPHNELEYPPRMIFW